MNLNNNYKRWHRPVMSESSKTKQGYAKIQNVEKYIGDPSLIIYRSSWEYAFIRYCDTSPSVLKWSSEPISVKYFDKVSKLEQCKKLGLDPNNPVNWELKNYNIDFWCLVDRGNGVHEKMFIEIKPESKLHKPVPPPKEAGPSAQKKFNAIAKEYIKNQAKFEAMNEYAKKNGAKFYVFTEKTLAGILGKFSTEQ